MREIEFRGLVEGHWQHGFYINNLSIDEQNIPEHAIITDHGRYTVDEKTIGQYTGIKDRDGNKIFAGDIITGNHSDLFYIESFDIGLMLINIEYFGKNHNDFMGECVSNPQTADWLHHGLVMGNIYQNEKLLKVGKE